MRRSGTLLLLLALGAAVPASAQSLADVARKEQARRSSVSGGKVYTNASLLPDPNAPPAGGTPDPVATPDTGTTVPPVAASPLGSDEAEAPASAAAPDDDSWIRGGDEAYWRRRAMAVRLRVARAQEQLDKVSGTSQQDPRLRARMDELRSKAEVSLARAQQDLDRFLQEAAAREVPASWVEP